MDPVEEECQARRAEEQVQQDLPNITPAPVLNRERGRERERGRGRGRQQSKFYLTSANVPQNLEDAILDLHRRQLAQQQQRTTQGHRGVEVERQRQVEINQIIEEWRNEDADTLDYKGQQNRGDDGDLNVDRNMQENIMRVVSNIFHSLLVDEY